MGKKDKEPHNQKGFRVEPPHELDKQALEQLDREQKEKAAPLREKLEQARLQHEVAQAAAEEIRQQYAAAGRSLPAPIFTRRELVHIKRIAKDMCSVEALHHIHQYELEVMSSEPGAIRRMIRRKAREEVDAWLEFYHRLDHLNDEEANRNGIGFLIRDESDEGFSMCLAHFDPKYQDVLESPRLFEPEEFAKMRAYVEMKVDAHIESCWSATEKALTYARAAQEITERVRQLHPQGTKITADFKGEDLETRKQLVKELQLETEQRIRIEALLGINQL